MKINLILLVLLCSSALLFSCGKKQKTGIEEQIGSKTISEIEFVAFLDSLKQAGADDYQTINAIRKYLASHLDFGDSLDSLSVNYYKMPWQNFSAFHCIELFRQNKLTSKCGLSSYVLAKLYDYAGYRNYIYNCGYDHIRLSHEFNLVQINGKFIVQDAFMNMTINNVDGTPKDFFQALAEIKKGEFSNINIAKDSITSNLWLNMLTKEMLNTYCIKNTLSDNILEILAQDDRIKITISRNYNFLAENMLSRLTGNFEKDGFSNDFLSIYLKPMHLRDGNSGAPADSLMNVITTTIGGL